MEIRKREIEENGKELIWLLFLPKTRQQRKNTIVGAKLVGVERINLQDTGSNQQMQCIAQIIENWVILKFATSQQE